MSTNAFLFIHIPKELVGKVISFNQRLLPKGLELCSPDNFKIISPSLNKLKPIILKEGYLRICVHEDGKPDDTVGCELIEHYDTLKKALNLFCLGSITHLSTCPIIIGGPRFLNYPRIIITPDILRTRNESKWKDVKPRSVKTLSTASMSYNYLFTDGKWSVKTPDKNADWIPLDEARKFLSETDLNLDEYNKK